MRSILIEHAKRYSQWDINDLYKLIHQAAMGSEHALTDESRVRELLIHELTNLVSGSDEFLIDPISPDGRITRIHLRPFLAHRLEREFLLQAFIRTAAIVHPSPELLIEFGMIAIELTKDGLLPFSEGQLIEYLAGMHHSGFPAVHHSARYKQLYQPAYRIVARELLPKEIVLAA